MRSTLLVFLRVNFESTWPANLVSSGLIIICLLNSSHVDCDDGKSEFFEVQKRNKISVLVNKSIKWQFFMFFVCIK